MSIIKGYYVRVTSSSDPDGAADLTESGYLFYYLAATVAFASRRRPRRGMFGFTNTTASFRARTATLRT